MEQSNWQYIWKVFDNALTHESDEERSAYVRAACRNDERLRSEVLSLLEAHRLEGVLDQVQRTLYKPLTSAVAPSAERIGPYVLKEEIGRGGMGVVFKARDERLQRPVALKMLPAHLSADDAAKTRFVTEARAAAGLEHANIATVYDIGEAPDGRLYIAMAYYPGQTLDKRIAASRFDPPEAIGIAIQIARGLLAAHRSGIVHRDIKPANILLTPDGTVKILDFGIAKVADLGITRLGTMIGTVAYMSPEQALGDPVDHRSDLWSLGVVLFEMLTGSRPFAAEYSDALIYAILNEEPRSVISLRQDLSAAVDQVVRRALRRDPSARFRSALEFIDALEKAGTAVSDSPRVETGAPSRPRIDAPERMGATVIVAQLVGYHDLVETLVPGDLADISERFRQCAEEVIRSYDGAVYQFEGDALVALFGIPVSHEDDFVRAIRAARELRSRFLEIGDDVERRTGRRLHPATGIDTGHLVVQSDEAGALRVTGEALQRSTQLSLHAAADEILLSADCERLVRPFFITEAGEPLRMKGTDCSVTPYRVGAETGSETRIDAAEKAGLTAHTGRELEVETLWNTFERSVNGPGHLVTVAGDAGLGKSRLLYEFRRQLPPDVHVLRGRCQSYGSKIPYHPFIGVLREHLKLGEDALTDTPEERVVGRIRGIDPSLEIFVPLYLHLLSIPGRRFPVPEHLQGEDLRMAMVEALAGVFTLSTRERPIVMLLEDWHWSDEASREVLKQLAELSSSHRLLVVVTFRPELQPDWGHSVHHTALNLRPLDERSSATVIRSVLGAGELPLELPALLHARTGGNPFFLEEVCRALIEENVVNIEDGLAVATRSLSSLHLPDTVQAVIRTRLHRLDPVARKVMRVASVVGRDFSRQLLRKILRDELDLIAAIDTLRELGLVQQIRVLPDAVYRFKHVLTQEVVYESLLKHQRKALHEEIGSAIEQLFAHRLDEHLDLLVHHFSRAESWEKAARFGRLAAKRSVRLSQFPESDAMLRDVRSWLQMIPDDGTRRRERIDVLFEHERVCETLGDRAEQQRIIDELLALVQPESDPSLTAEVLRRQGDLHILRRQLTDAETALDRAMKIARSAEDPDVERRTLRSLGFLRWNQGRSDEALALNEEVLALHLESGDDRAVIGDLVNLCIITRDLGRFDVALNHLDRAEEILERLDNPSMDAYIAHGLGKIYHLAGDLDRAVVQLERARQIAETHRLPLQLSFDLMSLAHIYLKQGLVEKSIELYEEAIELSRRSRYADGLAKSLRVFGDVLTSLSRYDEAVPYLKESAEWFARLEDAKSEADTLIQIASIHEERNEAEEADGAWQRIAGLLDDLDSEYELNTIEAFARLARMRGSTAEALSYYHDAIELARRTDRSTREAGLRNTAGILEWQRGAYEAALAQYEIALEIFRDDGNESGSGLMLNSIGVTLHKMGRTDESIERLREALEKHRAAGNDRLAAHALAALGDAYLSCDLSDDALTMYAESLQLRWQLNDRRGEGWMLHHLAVAHQSRGESDRAKDYARQAAVIAEELAEARLARACSEIIA